MSRVRLDVLLGRRGILESRERARAAIMSGEVFVDGRRADKPGAPVDESCGIEYRGGTRKYVSRGGLKLEKALDFFAVSPDGLVCLDCGASTGGFTDCLLRRGAARVYAVDVGYGQLAWSLRNDPRVTVMERTNIRYVTADIIPEPIELAVIDVSFISLALVLPVVRALTPDGARTICLIKPQFEAGRGKVGKKGVVRDIGTHIEVLRGFARHAQSAGFVFRGLTFSPVKGPEGNIEYLGLLSAGGKASGEADGAPDIAAVAERAHNALNLASVEQTETGSGGDPGEKGRPMP
ncbi:MAG: TlyA family RNA methyltransferase [Oscillospiraceae bacterium]|jgi:23S rRNA (cytidine1920-2'-O)/16S rRNA (cytidine1409-2'-O)-methyltransferase|nr:TlyA family RNA methyltransferase [Oscillospiraceae bacterium]